MTNTYRFSFPSFIRGEFNKKFSLLNKKLLAMPNGEEVVIVNEEFTTKKILKPEVRKHMISITQLIKAGASLSSYIPNPNDYLEVAFTTVEVTIPGINKIPGFQLAGTINIEGNVKTIYAIDDSINLTEVDIKTCHHCNTSRKRNRLHVFKELSSGEFKSIGSTCVHEYVGLDIDKVLNTFFNFYKEDDLYSSKGMSSAWGYPIAHLADACRVAYALDHTYKKFDTKQQVDNIHHALYGVCFNQDDNIKYLDILSSAPKVGNLLINTYININEKESNFNSNLVETLFYVNSKGDRQLRDFIVGKARGIFIWAVFNALKLSYNQNTKPSTTITTNSSHVGLINDKITISGIVVVLNEYTNDYGTKRLVVVKDDNGNLFKTNSSSKSVWDVKKNTRVTMQGKIIDHGEFKGQKQTIVSYAQFS